MNAYLRFYDGTIRVPDDAKLGDTYTFTATGTVTHIRHDLHGDGTETTEVELTLTDTTATPADDDRD